MYSGNLFIASLRQAEYHYICKVDVVESSSAIRAAGQPCRALANIDRALEKLEARGVTEAELRELREAREILEASNLCLVSQYQSVMSIPP